MRKVTIIGAGFVGSSTAYTLFRTDLVNQICLIDVQEQKAAMEAEDISHGSVYHSTHIWVALITVRQRVLI